ncbi:hypothetical protein [Methylobacterium mesophilicum]
MTAFEQSLLRAQIALLRSTSPTKGPAGLYGEDDWRRALSRVSKRLTAAPYRRPAPRSI